ncbi:MAG: tetratricopeptide repeat protein [Deltaproteobacteria bacterium]|nr:tetratricopeptide repeat protein [Deltaproteobacteria bacterium]
MKRGSVKTSSHYPFMAILAIVIIVSAVYSNSFTGSWHYDDFHHIKQNLSVRKISNLPLFFYDPSTFSGDPSARMYRPLLMASYAVNYQLAQIISGDGYAVSEYHILNFLFHLLATMGVFLIVFFLLQRNTTINPLPAAIFSGLLFGLHPVNAETVVYISARSSGLATMFAFFAFYIYARETARTPVRFTPLVMSAFLYLCGLMTKEIVIVLPVLILYYELLLNRAWMKAQPPLEVIKILMGRLLPFLLASGSYLWIRHIVLGENLYATLTSRGGSAAAPDFTSQLATQAKVWVIYIREILWPTSLSIDKSLTVSRHFSDPTVILSLIILSVIIAVAIGIRKKHPLVTFGTLWFFTALLPTSLFRLNVAMNDHRLYLGSLGAVLVATQVPSFLFRKNRSENGAIIKVFYAICLAILILLGTNTFHRNMVFATDETLWKDVLKNNPDSLRANQALGYFYWQDWRLRESYIFFKKALALGPEKPETHINMAAVLKDLGKTQAALEELKTAVRLSPNDPDVHFNLARLYRFMGDRGAALTEYRQTLLLNPRHSLAMSELRKLSGTGIP